MKTFLLSLAFLCLLGPYCRAQIVERDIREFQDTALTSTSVLDQASASFTGTSPNVTLKTYKLNALIGNGTWDLFIYNTLPTLTIERTDSLQAFSDDLLNQLGGLLNFSLSREAYFANGGDELNKDIKGGIFNFRLGSKVLDSRARSAGNDIFIPVLQSSLDLQYRIPLVDPKKKNPGASSLKDFAVGNLSVRLYGTFMRVLNQDLYNQYYTSERGVPPRKTLLTANAEVNLFITNAVFISAGYTISNEANIPERAFFSISYAR